MVNKRKMEDPIIESGVSGIQRWTMCRPIQTQKQKEQEHQKHMKCRKWL